MSSRSKRLIALVLNKRDTSVKERLDLPTFETTKGTTRDHRSEYFKAIQKINDLSDFDDSIENSESDYVPSNLTTLSDVSTTNAGSNIWQEVLEYTIFPEAKESNVENTKNCLEKCVITENTFKTPDFITAYTGNTISIEYTSDDRNDSSNKENINQLQQIEMETTKLNCEEVNMRSDLVFIEDTEITNDLSPQHIKIRSSKKNVFSGKRQRDKKHCCHLCYNVVCNLPRHFEKIHAQETEVAKILALPKRSLQRRQEFGKLQRTGDFYHNCEVLKIKKGELILLRVPTPHEKLKYTYHDYGPCPSCLGFMLKKHISIHLKQNKCSEKTSQFTNPISQCNSLLNGIYGSNIADDFLTNIVNKMKNDDITKTCKDDELILKFGNMIYEKYNLSQAELIRQSMRQLGRLLQEVNKISLPNLSLAECVVPEKIDVVINATKSLCTISSSVVSRPEFGTPSLGLKIGHHLKKCANIERGSALRKGDVRRDKEIKSFIEIMELEWNIKISSNALHTLYKRKFNSAQLLPLTTDLLKLNKYLEREMNLYQTRLKEEPTLNFWTTLASLILCRIVLFNKRRSGEAAKITLDQYKNRPSWNDQSTEEIKESLTSFENKLAEKLILVEVEGKRGRKVAILLTPDLKNGIDLLINKRDLIGISSKNPYIFARSSETGHLRGHDCLTKYANLADLQFPENVKSTKLRKYIATVCQIFNLSENETDWLARHLGHDIRIHREFYRIQENAIELTKVSRLLLAIDKGEAKNFSGKRLEDINIQDLPYLEDSDPENAAENSENQNSPPEVQTDNTAINTLDENITGDTNEKHQRVASETNKPAGNKKTCKKTPWSASETEAVVTFFRHSISKGIVPRKEQCMECLQKNISVLGNRRWTDIKFHVKNYIARILRTKKK